MHAALPAVELECAGHALQSDAPVAFWYLPAGQDAHGIIDPSSLLYVPTLHAVHRDDSTLSFHDPGAHGEQCPLASDADA